MTFRSIGKWFAGTAPVLLIWIASSQPSRAQRITGDIVGTITDSSGSAIPNTKVTLRSLDTGQTDDDLGGRAPATIPSLN